MECVEQVKQIAWLGESWGYWIQTVAFLLTALAGVAVIYYNARQARIRATIDLIIHQKTDQRLLAAIDMVYALSRTNVQFSSFADQRDSEECKAILLVLNNHEFIACGIRQKVFNEKIYKLMQYSNVMKMWNVSNGIIAEIRNKQGKDTLFQEFEWLSRRWKIDKIVTIKA